MLIGEICTGEMSTLVQAIKTVFTLIQIAIPGVLIVLGTIDMFKAMSSGDEKKTKEAQKTFIRRLIYAVVAFLVPFIIRLVFNFVSTNITLHEGDETAANALEKFFACWNNSNGGGSGNEKCWYYDNTSGSWKLDQNNNTETSCEVNGNCWGTQKDCQ